MRSAFARAQEPRGTDVSDRGSLERLDREAFFVARPSRERHDGVVLAELLSDRTYGDRLLVATVLLAVLRHAHMTVELHGRADGGGLA